MTDELNAAATSTGRVYLIGAGPGAPGLITLRGVQLLEAADAVLYDYLANPKMLEHARPDALIQCVGKHGTATPPSADGASPGCIWSQDAINARMIELARAGKRVVRLKGGDPSIFARATEEIAALEAERIQYEIIPGVTTAMAAAAFAASSLTDRDQASAVALVTGRESEKADSHMDYAALARFPGALVIYMGVVSVAEWSRSLIAAGKPGDSPCAIIRRCSLPDQQTWQCRLDGVADLVQSERLRPPIVFVVGRPGWREQGQSWFEQKPLFGRRVVVTRPRGQGGQLNELLEEQGADVLNQPAIELAPLDEGAARDALDDVLARLADFDWVVFSSSNGARFTVNRMRELQLDARAFATTRLAAVGPMTAAALSDNFLQVELVADQANQEGMAKALLDAMNNASSPTKSRVLLLRASRGRNSMCEHLEQAGCQVEHIVAYQSRDVAAPDEVIADSLSQRPADWIVAASSASAESAFRLLNASSPDAKWAAVSSLTADRLQALGANVKAVAAAPDMASIVEAILAAELES